MRETIYDQDEETRAELVRVVMEAEHGLPIPRLPSQPESDSKDALVWRNRAGTNRRGIPRQDISMVALENIRME